MLPGPGSTNPAALHAEPADDAANSGTYGDGVDAGDSDDKAGHFCCI